MQCAPKVSAKKRKQVNYQVAVELFKADPFLAADGARPVIQADSPDAVPTEDDEKLNAIFKNLSLGDEEGMVPLPEMKGAHDLADMLVAYATCPGTYLIYMDMAVRNSITLAWLQHVISQRHSYLEKVFTMCPLPQVTSPSDRRT